VSGATTIIEALRGGLADELATDERVFVMGEDVEIGGSFHLTLGLRERFGGERVRDTPVAEAGFVGLAIGAALAGRRPVVDFQYGDFLLCAADQVIQQASKLRFMSGDQLSVPLVLHAPTGASGRGAQHANSIENLFFGVPGLSVAVPATPYDAKGAMTTAIRSSGPVLICSHKHLYGSKGRRSDLHESLDGGVPDHPFELPIGSAAVRRAGGDLTIVAALLMVHRALEAAEQLAEAGVEAEVIDLRWLSPLDTDTVVESVRRTGRLLVVEEGPPRGGWGAHVAAAAAAEALRSLRAPVRRLNGPDSPMPFAPHLEAQVVPSVELIRDTARELVESA
jgi:acetoin:2,6-dichlorophenolindophenol oxidoreductase subunit beta